MKPLIVLFTAFIIGLIVIRFIHNEFEIAFSARIAMSFMLIFTAIGHFIFADGMAMMIPDFIPFKKEVVYFTGIVEIAAALGLHFPKLRVLTAWLLILFFILILPANIKAAINRIDIQKASNDGNGLNYLWFRVPEQILFIAWTYFSTIFIDEV